MELVEHGGTELLSRRLTEFVSRPTRWRPAIRLLRDRLQGSGWATYVFGGTLRDILLHSAWFPPRDLDLVVDGVALPELEDRLEQYIVRRTRFGGLHLLVDKLPVDIWPLDTTWAFRERYVAQANPSELPKTTFLNVEAIVAELFPRPGRGRRIYDGGFFGALSRRLLDINLEPNPFPALCVVRAIVMGSKLNFAFSPRLVDYIKIHSLRLSWSDLESAQYGHYGRLCFDNAFYLGCLDSFDRVANGETGVVPRSGVAEQLGLDSLSGLARCEA